MLRILPTYVLREHIGPYFLALLVIKLLFVLNILYRDLGKFLSKGIPVDVIFEFLFLNLAWMIALAIPMAVLSSSIMAYGRLSADNEITAMRASGISLYQVSVLVLVVAAGLAGGLVWFNNSVLPDFNHRLRLLAMDIARKKPTIDLEAGVIYNGIPNYSILAQKVVEVDSVSYVENVIIYDESESHLNKTIVAKRGTVCFHQSTGLLDLTLFDGELQEVNIHDPAKFKRLAFPKHAIKIPLTEMLLIRSNSEYRGDREKSAAALMEDVRLLDEKIAQRWQELNQRATQKVQELTKPRIGRRKLIDNLVSEHEQLLRQIKMDLDVIDSYHRSQNIYLVEVHKKYSIPAACVALFLVGAPLGVLIRKRGWAVSAGLSIGFFLLYWALLIGGEILADREFISPFTAMWGPNILAGVLGVFLVRKAVRGR